MKTKHTPGEWMVLMKDQEPCTEIVANTDGGNYVIAEAHSIGNECDLTQAEANAKLMSAAPEMLHALQGLLSDVLDLLNKNKSIKLGTMGTIHIVQAQQAIKKATS